MKFFKIVFTDTLKSCVNIKGWLGISQFKENSYALIALLKRVFAIREPARKETFEQAVARFNLSEEDLKKRAQSLIYQAIFYISLAILAFVYSIYWFYHIRILPGFICILVFVLFSVIAISRHFLYFQIKNRKLGCTFKEWLKGKVTVTEQKL